MHGYGFGKSFRRRDCSEHKARQQPFCQNGMVYGDVIIRSSTASPAIRIVVYICPFGCVEAGGKSGECVAIRPNPD